MTTRPDDPVHPVSGGLTKREDFAKAAMTGILASWCSDTGIDDEWIAGKATRLADALIAALNEEKR